MVLIESTIIVLAAIIVFLMAAMFFILVRLKILEDSLKELTELLYGQSRLGARQENEWR